ncbi:MAG: phosphomethylpyrimidine kinase [Gemmatimonas sp. SG8_23]|jgi:hydroxymethylpyrimidine/phosphomethylpyrimidine kinase|nr:MAG: phosphomethylpyrimidine kinase [Gemmatimonas sp. SG8_23]
MTPTTAPTLRIALTIAGSDSGGGAGIQADLKTFHQFGVYGTSVITAVTAQNTTGVRAIHPVPLATVRAQLDAVVEDLRPAAVKTGMLATAELTREVAAGIAEHRLDRYVMDPVMVATSGDRLLEAEAEQALREHLLPLAAVVTPNLEEAAILTGGSVRTLDEMRAAARALVDLGASAALVKGGHLADSEGTAATTVVDLLWDGTREHVWRRTRIDTRHTHGTGCTLSAAIAAGLARGRSLQEAVSAATAYIGRAIATAPRLGSGRGPVNHFAPAD